MKKVALGVSLSLAFVVPAFAASPFSEGVYSLSGSASYSRRKSDGDTLTGYSFAPSFFYFIRQGLAVGTSVTYRKAEYERIEYESRGIGPLVRYYFADTETRPFVEFQYRIDDVDSRSKTSGVIGNDNDTSTMVLSIGNDIFLARNVALEPTLSFTSSDINYKDDSKFEDVTQTEVSASLGVTVFVY